MADRILIIGWNYLGIALIDLYRDKNFDVTIVDKVFSTNKIASLSNNQNFKFINAKKLDKVNIRDYDIVYNLLLIEKYKHTGTSLINEIISYSKRLIQVSTCKAFENLNELIFNLDENSAINHAKITNYAKRHLAIEEFIKQNHKNFVICRTPDIYGYTDAIKPNLSIGNKFIFDSILNNGITLFNDGVTVKPFCHVRDVANALYYLAHKPEIKCETFNIVHNNFKFIDLANMIKNKFNTQKRL